MNPFDPKAHFNNVSWTVRKRPFMHCHVVDVFADGIYSSLDAAFQKKLAATQNDKRPKKANYDAKISGIKPGDADDFFPLFHPAFLKTLAAALGLNVTFEIDAAIHAHPAGSRSGWLHNDYNPGWFCRQAIGEELLFSESDDCSYKRGPTKEKETAVERIRYLTLIYYVHNQEWQTSNGGQTGIYSRFSQDVLKPDYAVPPMNNSMLFFECTPHSFHSFMKSTVPRGSITLWLHRPIEIARKEWPHHEPIYWS